MDNITDISRFNNDILFNRLILYNKWINRTHSLYTTDIYFEIARDIVLPLRITKFVEELLKGDVIGRRDTSNIILAQQILLKYDINIHKRKKK